MKKILIIEDNSVVANTYRTKLESRNYAVNVASDGQTGYYAISETKPDAVLLDLTVPQMDALSVLGKVRAQKQFKKLPVFVLADSDTSTSADDAILAGATHCFNKSDDGALDEVICALDDLFPSVSAKKSARKKFAVAAPSHSIGFVPAFADEHETGGPHVEQFSARKLPVVEVAARLSSYTDRDGDAQAVYSSSARSAEIAYAERSAIPVLPKQNQGTNSRSKVLDPPEIDSREIQDELQGHFLASYGSTVHAIRCLFVSLINAKGVSGKVQSIEELWTQIRSLRSSATQSGMVGLARLCTPLEALAARAKGAEPENAHASLQKLANTIDLLVALSNHLNEIEPLNRIEPRVLVVDDESVSRKALTLSLQKAQIVVVGAKDSNSALIEVEGGLFDLMFLDVEMPGINGFGLCARIRMLPPQKSTPIIFVSSLEDLKSRASSRISGGNHFITKPVNFDEVNLTALTFIFKHRLRNSLQERGNTDWTKFR